MLIAAKAGFIHVWTKNYKELMRLSYTESLPEMASKARSLDCTSDGKRIVVGTLDSQIVELVSTDLELSQNSKYLRSDINKGPFTPDSVERYEMWGLAVFTSPEKRDRFLTCSDTGFIEVWSTKLLSRVSSFSVQSEDSENAPTKSGDKNLRCLAISGSNDLVLIVNIDRSQLVHSVRDSKGLIRDLKFSPNGLKFAVATSDNTLEVYTTQDYKRRANLKKFRAAVSHLDWSTDSKWVQGTSDVGELLQFDAQEYDVVRDAKMNDALRNEEWTTMNCDRGWAVQGIHKQDQFDPHHIRVIDRSNRKFYNEYQILAVGDNDGILSLYKYPCVQPSAEAQVGHGHASSISNLKWTADDRHLITTGCDDQTIIIWEVRKTS